MARVGRQNVSWAVSGAGKRGGEDGLRRVVANRFGGRYVARAIAGFEHDIDIKPGIWVGGKIVIARLRHRALRRACQRQARSR